MLRANYAEFFRIKNFIILNSNVCPAGISPVLGNGWQYTLVRPIILRMQAGLRGGFVLRLILLLTTCIASAVIRVDVLTVYLLAAPLTYFSF